MTKYILIGGYVQKAADGGRAFVEELVKDVEGEVRLLDCMFAREQEVWADKFEEDKKFLSSMASDRNIEAQLADLDSFIEQVQWANTIFIRGGSSTELVSALQERDEWRSHLAGKTVAGTSAGADALSTYYFNLHTCEVAQGLGVLPVKVIPHFKSDYHGWEFDWDNALKRLESFGEKLPTHALREGEFVVEHL